jgi:hypothetical protein
VGVVVRWVWKTTPGQLVGSRVAPRVPPCTALHRTCQGFLYFSSLVAMACMMSCCRWMRCSPRSMFLMYCRQCRGAVQAGGR